MRKAVPVLALLLVLAGCEDRTGAAYPTEVVDPVIRLPAVPGRPGTGYFRISAPPERVALTAVSSPRAERIEMHETISADGRVSMRRIAREEVRHQDILFRPGGGHLMIFGLDPALQPGDRAALTFHFARGAPVTVQARVVGAGDEIGG